MALSIEPRPPSQDRAWFIVGRWQEYDGEQRANFLRIIGIGAFYLVELINYHGIHLGVLQMPAVVDRAFHLAVTFLAVAWLAVALGVFLCLRSHVFPAALKYISTGCDLVLLTSILCVADGPRSPLVVGFFLILVLAALRFDLGLIWFSTVGAAAGYLYVLGYARWFTERDIRVPRYHQVIFLLTLALTGVLLGQMIRQVRRMAVEYSRRQSPSNQGTA